MATNLNFLVAIGKIQSPMATKITKFPGLEVLSVLAHPDDGAGDGAGDDDSDSWRV